jgi:peroxiredoxin/predicted 2-oxoglutarate/Fe(II)-dependent dioxygenase YbiX
MRDDPVTLETLQRRLMAGDPMPTITGRASGRDHTSFANLAGHYTVFCAFGSAADELARQTLERVFANRALFDDRKVAFFGVSTDPADESLKRVRSVLPGVRFLWDFDRSISRQLGAIEQASDRIEPCIVIVDPSLRVYAVVQFANDMSHADRLIAAVKSLPDPAMHAGVPMHAPVLIVPRIFEPTLCARLIELYDTLGGNDSGFMRDVDGRTVGIIDYRMKRRSDHEIVDRGIKNATQRRIARRLLPEIEKAFQFKVTRIERYIVACYDAGVGGYFKPHRDNTTLGTAHRRFAVTINLNTGDYEGGGLNFPEYGPQVYHAPRGGAVVFSCSMLHQAMPVERGKRYVFLPFLYDEAGAAVRRANSVYLARKPEDDSNGKDENGDGDSGSAPPLSDGAEETAAVAPPVSASR